MKLAVVFPGQGSQYVGMGQEWLTHDLARAVFARADSALPPGISDLCFNGPEDQLKLTENTQPAILTASFAVYSAIREQLPAPAFFAGHSLGEYTALVAAGALSLEDALTTVRLRGQLMQTAVPVGQGAMAAVMRLEAHKISEINAEVNRTFEHPVEVANLNSPEQIVVSGGAGAVRRAMELYLEAGARRAVELPVSAPFHSSLMIPAADGLKPMLDGLVFSAVRTPVIANLTVGSYPTDPAQYPLLLHAQIFNPVRWAETTSYFAENGVTHLIEVGPGKVLRMLTMKTDRSIMPLNVDKPADLASIEDWLKRDANV